MLGLSPLHRALCGALLATTLAACSSGDPQLDGLGDTDSGKSPSTAADAGANSGGSDPSNNSGSGGKNDAGNSGNVGVDAGGSNGRVDAGGNSNGSVDAGGSNGRIDAGNDSNGTVDAGGSNGSSDAGGHSSGSLDAGGSNGSPDAGSNGTGSLDAGGSNGSLDASTPVHPLAGDYAVRTVIYARQKADALGEQLDVVSEGTLLSVVNISDSGAATERYCFIETTNPNGITSWTLPEATQRIPESVSQLVADGDSFVRAAAADRTFVSWSPVLQPDDCVAGQTHSTGCLCGDPSGLPISPEDCRVLDLDGDGVEGGALYVGGRATDPTEGVSGALVKLNIVGEKSIAWRLPNEGQDRFVAEVVGGLAQSELSREGDDAILSQFGRIRNSICPGEYSHAEFVRGSFTCASIMAGRSDADLDSYGIFDPSLDSDLGQNAPDGIDEVEAPRLCPDPDACEGDLVRDSCGVCGGDGSTCGTCATDTDADGTVDCRDTCLNDPDKTEAGACGCGVSDVDGDGDGTPDCSDLCPSHAGKIEPGTCGCATADTDGDDDGTLDCNDLCPSDEGKVAPGVCGCATADTDSDGDGTLDCNDTCPNDAPKTAPGTCGCATADTDSDADGLADCNDACPDDANKTTLGLCGCGTADTDTDEDAEPDCTDECDADPEKTVLGACGCGVADTDTDSDGAADCNDECPNDAPKTAPGTCGCVVADSSSDGDSVVDCVDNCPSVANQDQANWDADGEGDACDDADGDSVLDSVDNCRAEPNNTQIDTDNDGLGNACDLDDDNDGTADLSDGCPVDFAKNEPGQCGCAVLDTDADADGIADCVDNCLTVANPSQANWNADAEGDACDDSDGDSVLDITDNCRSVANPDQLNTDRDSQGDACDPDDDNDNRPDTSDNCPTTPNTNQANWNGDAEGDVCDDSDSDGVLDSTDNCRSAANPDQLNTDGDTQGNACDPDDDNDFRPDATDNCSTVSNWHQTDTDGDGLGNACDPDDDNDGTLDPSDQCTTDPAKTAPGSCGCGFAEDCGAAHPLTGRYLVRSALFSRARRGATVDQVKAIGLSVVNVTRDGTMSDVSCFAYTAPLSNGAWWSWQKPRNAQAIRPVITTLTQQGSDYRREPVRNQLGYRMSLCSSTCACEQVDPSILIPPFVKPNPPNHCSLIDDDGDGILGITALGQQAAFANPNSNPLGLFSATLQVASSTASHWTITPNVNGAGWHQGTAGDDGSYQNVVGCNSLGCGQLEDVVNTPCPETWATGSNKVWFRPIEGEPTHDVDTNLALCPNLVSQWNVPGYFMPDGVAPNDGTICPAP